MVNLSSRHLNLRILGAFLLVGFAHGQSPSRDAQSNSGLDLNAIDKSADPCQNFYQYACGSWMKNNSVPSDESRWSRFNELNQRNQIELRDILEDSARNQSRSEVDQKIGGFYQSCMNEPEIERRGAKPLDSELERIAHIGSKRDLVDEVARLHQRQVSVFFRFGPAPDLKNAKMNIADFDQGGLGLPEKDYYFRTDPKSVEIRQKYVSSIAKIFSLIGVAPSEAEKKASLI
ncbi:MAG: M13 family metallopeptidase, partial [Acidobacteriota bacterium]|nr:M13 family metallopeptidase [Acidobacteriota bacterium]